MKAQLRLKHMVVEVEGNSQLELFRNIAEMQEVFGEACCGNCNKEEIRYRVRNVNGDDYYEMVCLSCGARLSFGQSKKEKGKLFPIRKITEDGRASRKEGTYDNQHRGWAKYQKPSEAPPVQGMPAQGGSGTKPPPRK